MEVLNAGEIAAACGGVLMNSREDLPISGVSTDTRKIAAGDMFIALKGESFDGHDFIEKAVECGASLVLAEKLLPGGNIPCIIVRDTLKALQDIAKYYRGMFQIPFVAVTGSAGKTTTKDMIAAVLSQKFKVLKTEGNLNNAIGLPLTILNLQRSHEVAVLEMGMNSFGEIKLLSDIVRQDVGVISNVGTAHIEMLGSRENILKAKLEIFSYFGKENTAVINGDNDLLSGYHSSDFRVIKYGLESSNDYHAYEIMEKGEDGIDFAVDLGGVKSSFTVMLPGRHNVYNALSAIAVARLFGMETEDIRKGLMSFKPSKLRMDIVKLDSGVKIINDAYNANPESMKAAIDVLRGMKSGGRSICILGDMLELGDFSQKEHYNVGSYAAASGADMLIAVGSFSGDMKNGAVAKGIDSSLAFEYASAKEVIAVIDQIIKPGDVVLIKGSRRMKMEEIVDFLRERR